MAVLSPTKVTATEFGGDLKLFVCTVVPQANGDTITFVAATHKFRTIYSVQAVIEVGLDAAWTIIVPTFSGLVVTLTSLKADGATSADDFTGARVRLIMVVGNN